MATLATGLTLALCLGLLYSLGTTAYDDSRGIIMSQTQANEQELSYEIANAIGQQLELVGDSVNKVSASYSSSLLISPNISMSTPPFQLLAPFPSFAEFDFITGCASTGNCPADFGALKGRSRIPVIAGFENGSLAHTSTYLYSSAQSSAIKDSVAWAAAFASSPALADVRDALAVQDEDQRVMYMRGANTTVMFYLSAKVAGNGTGQYHALHRTYPGMRKNDTVYDPTVRPWFSGARSDVIHFYGPYVETFTKQQVLTLSFKQTLTYRNHTVEAVSAAVVLLDSFRQLVGSIAYTNGGFAAIFNRRTQQALVWGNRTDLVDPATSTFRTVQSLDPRLPADDLCAEPTFEYTDAAGTTWLVACADAFNASVSSLSSSSAMGSALTVMVFAQRDLAEQPLLSLRTNIDRTTSTVTSTVLILAFGGVGGGCILVCLTLMCITKPLETMREVAREMVEVMAEDEEVRDFTPVLQKALFNLRRTDEVGVLACDFYHVMCLMHNKVVERRLKPKYPLNPWQVVCEQEDAKKVLSLSWTDLQSVARRTVPALGTTSKLAKVSHPRSDGLDVLGALTAALEESSKDCELAAISVETASANPSYRCVPAEEEPTHAIDRASTTSNQLGTVPIVLSQPVGLLASLKSQLSALGAVLLAGSIAAMVATIVIVQHEGSFWSSETGDDVTFKQLTNLEAIVAVKATFVEAFFAQMSLDLLGGASFMSLLIAGNFTTPSWKQRGDFLPSFSIDPANPYSLAPFSALQGVSGYYSSADAGCSSAAPPSCATVHDANQTLLTSLLDIKMEAFFHPGSFLSFIQMGMDDTGFTRYWPYRSTSANSEPSSCLINAFAIPLCINLFAESKCGNPSSARFPPYESRCRTWYELARNHSHADLAYFQYPRQASDGSYVLTGVAPVVTGGALSSVLSLNFLASTLSTSINDLPILSSGYSYLVDAADLSVVLHPRQSATCVTVQCVEGMTAEEFVAFRRGVLLGGQATYAKGGEAWRAVTQPVRYGSMDYVLVGTVPDAEVLRASRQTQNAIDESSTKMIVGFSVAIAMVCVVMVWVVKQLISAIVSPIDDLRAIMQLALRNDLSTEMPKHASSLDIAQLMEAMSQLLVVLRFGSESYARGDNQRARSVFVDSVNLFTATGNAKGLGVSLNNLAAVELALGHHDEAADLYRRSISLAKQQVVQLEASWTAMGTTNISASDLEAPAPAPSPAPGPAATEDLRRAYRVLSDRQGNLAVVYLERNELTQAFALLEQLLEEDKHRLHIRGCIAKQSSLGYFYQRQREFKSAERIFASSLAFIRNRALGTSVCGFAMDEAERDACEMMALFNKAALADAQNSGDKNLAEVEHAYLEALMTPAHTDVGTVKRILQSLMALYGRSPRYSEAQLLVQSLAKEQGLSLAGEGSAAPKRAVFVIDYSGSMAGVKIRSAVENLGAIMKEHVRDHDSVCILSFNSSVQEVLPLTTKAGNEAQIMAKAGMLVAPNGGTALYDALRSATRTLRRDATSNDWIVVLTDGEDTSSHAGVNEVVQELSAAHVSTIAVGIGAEVAEDVMRSIAKATPQGVFIRASADHRGITEAFGQVARILQTSVVLEDY